MNKKSDLSSLSIEEIYELALRDNIKAEQDAIILYNKYINALPEGDIVRNGLEDIRDEERAHCGELYQLLFETDSQEVSDFEEGQNEVIQENKTSNRAVLSDWDYQLSSDDNYAWKEQNGLEGYFSVEPNEYGLYFWNVIDPYDSSVIDYGTTTSEEEAKKLTQDVLDSSKRFSYMKGNKMAKKIAKTKKYAMSVQDVVDTVIDSLEFDAPFDDEADAHERAIEIIDDQLIYTDDVFDLAKQYVQDSVVIDLFYEEFVGDVLSQIDLEDFVSEDYVFASKNSKTKTAQESYEFRSDYGGTYGYIYYDDGSWTVEVYTGDYSLVYGNSSLSSFDEAVEAAQYYAMPDKIDVWPV